MSGNPQGPFTPWYAPIIDYIVKNHAAIGGTIVAIALAVGGCVHNKNVSEQHGAEIQQNKEAIQVNKDEIQSNKEKFHDFKAAVIKEVPKTATPPEDK
jgi:hypothetical protein